MLKVAESTVEKKIKGRKRHIIVDTQGNLLHVEVHKANEHDTKAGCRVFSNALKKYPTIRGISGDAGYRGSMVSFVKKTLYKKIDIVSRIDKKWVLLPKRWVVERTFSWFGGFRRLAKDFEVVIDVAVNWIYIAHFRILLKRVAL